MKTYKLSKELEYGDKCFDCGGKNEPYMLTYELWEKLVPKKHRNKCICITCIQTRLEKLENRSLRLSDFLLYTQEPEFVNTDKGIAISELNPINFGIFGFSVLKAFANAEIKFSKKST